MQDYLNKDLNISEERHMQTKKLGEKIVLTALFLSESEMHKAQKEILEEIGKFFNCDRCYIRLFDSEQKNFTNSDEYAEYLKSDKIKSFLDTEFPYEFYEIINYPKTREIIEHKNLICLPKWAEQIIKANKKYAYIVSRIAEEYEIKSVYVSTLRIGSEIIGSLILHYTEDYVHLNEEELSFLGVISQKLAYFLRQIKLIDANKKINDREVLVREIIQKISDTKGKDIYEIKKHIIKSIGKVLNASRCYIGEHHLDKDGNPVHRLQYLRSPEIKEFQGFTKRNKLIEEGTYKDIIVPNTEQYLKQNNIDENSEIFQGLVNYNVQSFFSVPIRYNNIFMGSLILQYDKAYAFNYDDVQFVKIISDHIGIAINQSELYNSHKKSMEVERLLRNLITTLRSTINLDEMLTIICDEVGKAFNADRVLIIQCDHINDYTNWSVKREYTVCDSVKAHKHINIDKSIGLFWHDVVNKKRLKSYYIENVPEADFPEPLKSTYKVLESKSILGISIEKGDDKWGGLFLSNTKNYKQWSSEEIKLLEDISDHIYVAIKQAELYKTIENNAKKEKLLAEIMAVIKSNLKLDEILIIICNILEKFYSAGKIIINKIDKQEQKLSLLKKSYSKNKDDYKYSLKVNQYFYKILNGNKSLIINDIWKENIPEYVKKELKSKDINAVMMTPIYINSNETGAIIIESNEIRCWNREDISFLSRIADYISIAIKESNFYSQSEFISNVSHEIKTPISIINGYADALINLGKPDTKTAKKFLRIIKNNTERLNKLIESLLFISSTEKKLHLKNITFEKVKVVTLIDNSVDLCREKIKSKNIKIEKNIENITLKKGNMILLQQLMINFITNAVNYSEMNTVIKLKAVKNNKEILISVEDQGCGIKEEHLSNIFERFYRVDKSRNSKTGGTGLGLSISKLISEIHGGQITVKSIYGEGSVFTLHLPE